MMEGNKVDKCFSSPLKLLLQSEKKADNKEEEQKNFNHLSIFLSKAF